jgi:hypothetical protein
MDSPTSVFLAFVVLLFNDAVSRLYGISDRMINGYGAVGGMRIGKGN